MQSSGVDSWEACELAKVLPPVPTTPCVFCREVLYDGGARHGERSTEDVTTKTQTLYHISTQRRRRKRRTGCVPPRLSRPALDSRFSVNEKSSATTLRKGQSNGVTPKKKSANENSPSSSLSSLYTSESLDEDSDDDDRLSTTTSSLWSLTASTTSTPCSLDDQQAAGTVVGLPADYGSKYSSLQDWLARRRSLRHAMGSKTADITRWLRNKRKRTPLEERVLRALSKHEDEDDNVGSGGAGRGEVVKRASSQRPGGAFSRSRSDATEHKQSSHISRAASVGKDSIKSRTLSDEIKLSKSTDDHLTLHESTDQNLSQTASKSSDHFMESSSSELVSVVDAYLMQRRITLLDLFRCVDPRRRGTCSRRDFRYLLTQAKVPLTPEQTDQLADWLKVDGRHSDCLEYWRLALKMNRPQEMRLFRRPQRQQADQQVDSLQSSLTFDVDEISADSSLTLDAGQINADVTQVSGFQSSLTADVAETTASRSQSSLIEDTDAATQTAAATSTVRPELRGNESAACEEYKRSYCQRMINLFRDNALFDDHVVTGKTSARGKTRAGKNGARGKTLPSPVRRDNVRHLKSTMTDSDGGLMARRLEEIRLHDRIEYEATRDTVRRQRLPVSGRALRRGLLTAPDRPHSAIDARRLPAAAMLDPVDRDNNRHSETVQFETVHHWDSDDSLDQAPLQHGDPCFSDADDVDGSGDASSSWSFGLRVRAATSGSSRHSSASATRDRQSRHGSTLDGTDRDGDDEDNEEGGGENGEGGGDDGTAARDRWSTQADGGRRTRVSMHDLELRRIQWEMDEQLARRHAIYWPGRADHVRLYRDAERGGHPIFERVRQTWYNDDPRYYSFNPHCDEQVLARRQCQRQQPGWTVDDGPTRPPALYHCVTPINAPSNTDHSC